LCCRDSGRDGKWLPGVVRLALFRCGVILHTSVSSSRPATSLAQPTTSIRRERTHVSKPSVLVVDDNPDAADSLAFLVEVFGYRADTAYDGHTALARILAACPALALCDIGMPGMDGYELARAVRAKGIRLPLVAVTGYSRPEDVSNALQAGFDRHIAKPADPDAVLNVLRQFAQPP
jgi:CheY-like chemotaxis protein